MHTRKRTIGPLGLVLCALTVVSLSACGSKAADSTPTPGVEEIFTAAYMTFQAQSATELASTPPTPLPSPTLFPTLPPPSPVATIGGAPTFPSGSSACNSSKFVKDITIPDNTVIVAGATFDKTWELLNDGSCEWSTSYQLVFTNGDQMGGADTHMVGSVPAGSVVDITVSMVAPSGDGTYRGDWRMQDDQGQVFGDYPYVIIKVGSGQATLSPDDLTGTAAATP